MVSLVVWETHDGHAYSPKDIQTLRDLLDLSKDQWPDAAIHRHTDEVAVLIGMALGVARPATGKAYVNLVRREMLRPAMTFLKALTNVEFEREYLQPWTPLRRLDRDQLIMQVQNYVEAVDDHIGQIAAASRKGKVWDSELKDQFVEYVDILCEYFDHDFEPARAMDLGHDDHRFGEAVRLLASPLRWGNERGKDIHFDGAIRKRVDQWNEGLRQLDERLRKSRNG
jgi:hypothetical protein